MPAHGRHSIWHVSEANADATIDTAVVTLATYPEAEIRDKLRLLQLSSAFTIPYGLMLRALMSHSKIGMIAKSAECAAYWHAAGQHQIHHVRRCARHRRCRLARPHSRCISEMWTRRGRLGRIVLLSLPCDTQWVNEFPMKPDNRRFRGEGIWMGDRRSLVSAFETLERIHDKLALRLAPTRKTLPFWIHRGYHNDDQFLWQCLYKYQLADVGIDSDCESRSMLPAPGRRSTTGNTIFARRPSNRPGTGPVFISRRRTTHGHQQWYSLLTSADDRG